MVAPADDQLVGLGLTSAAYVVLAVLAVFATLEPVFGFCVGCRVFALLVRFGAIPERSGCSPG